MQKFCRGISTRNIENFRQFWTQEVCVFQSYTLGDVKFVNTGPECGEGRRYNATCNSVTPRTFYKYKTRWRRPISLLCCDKIRSGASNKSTQSLKQYRVETYAALCIYRVLGDNYEEERTCPFHSLSPSVLTLFDSQMRYGQSIQMFHHRRIAPLSLFRIQLRDQIFTAIKFVQR